MCKYSTAAIQHISHHGVSGLEMGKSAMSDQLRCDASMLPSLPLVTARYRADDHCRSSPLIPARGAGEVVTPLFLCSLQLSLMGAMHGHHMFLSPS